MPSPYWQITVLTFSSAVLISIVSKIWQVSGWMSGHANRLFSDEKVDVRFSLDDKD